ncbi:hypothetical protein [Streptomyces sp. NPDC002564]|uniref:hypothetical protein n=1 Tax=Streptomyces sp. NPDC002564 TaxID=3364649 RepID=UPI0036AE0159
MNSAPHLLAEDRAEYERLLDETLRTASARPELAALGERLTAEQLRTMALNATALLTSAAADEYAHYVALRERLRTAAHRSPSGRAAPGPGRRLGAAVLGAGRPDGTEVARDRWAGMPYGRRLLAALVGLRVRPVVPGAVRADQARASRPSVPRRAGGGRDGRMHPPSPSWGPGASRPAFGAPEGTGAGPFAAFVVLGTLLSGAVAALLLVVGLVLRLTGAAFAGSLIGAGWLVGALAVAGLLVAVIGVVRTALRDGRAGPGPEHRSELDEEVARAREEWHHALLERGVVPFLREALAGTGAVPDAARAGRIPRLGYSAPGPAPAPASADRPASGDRPRLVRPDFTSPDFGGPDTPPARPSPAEPRTPGDRGDQR